MVTVPVVVTDDRGQQVTGLIKDNCAAMVGEGAEKGDVR
jgi:hypothetical protein